MQCKPSKSELTKNNVSMHAHHFARTACRTLILYSFIFTKQKQDTAGQLAGCSSIVENGSRTLQDTCRTTCRTLAYRKKWEQDVAGLCRTPAEQPAGRSSIVKNGSRTLQDTCRTTCRTLTYCKKWEQDIAGLCKTPAGQPAGHSSIVKNGSRTPTPFGVLKI